MKLLPNRLPQLEIGPFIRKGDRAALILDLSLYSSKVWHQVLAETGANNPQLLRRYFLKY